MESSRTCPCGRHLMSLALALALLSIGKFLALVLASAVGTHALACWASVMVHQYCKELQYSTMNESTQLGGNLFSG